MNVSSAATALLMAVAVFVSVTGSGQSNSVSNHVPSESVADLVARLNPSQKQQFDDARTAYQQKRFVDCMAIHKLLLKDFPGDPILLKFASQAAIEAGDSRFATDALKPISLADPQDWQAAVLLARACAESGDVSCRDAQIAHVLELHTQGVIPAQLREFVVERVKLGDKTLLFNNSIVPWGQYKVSAVGDVKDSTGKLLMTISLESSDFDQAPFAKDHPDEAAKGTRMFSLDAYRETGLNSNGQRTQTHFTFKFFTGQPAYSTVREEFINVANGKSAPISSRTGLVVP
jgi:hypothetical protein